jgi:hypothetical protein
VHVSGVSIADADYVHSLTVAYTTGAPMFYVQYKDDQDNVFRPEFTDELEAAQMLSSVRLYSNLTLIGHNVDHSKFEPQAKQDSTIPSNVVRCVVDQGPIKASTSSHPHQCADCGRSVFVFDGLVKQGYHWESKNGYLIYVETTD